MLKRYLTTALFLVMTTGTSLLLGTGCDGEEDPAGCPPNSDAEVTAGLNLIDQRCASCHTTTAQGSPPGGLDFTDMQVIVNNADTMLRLVQAGTMPPGAPLEEAEVDQVSTALICISEGQ